MTSSDVELNGRSLKLHKAIVDPQFGTKSVLTNSHWSFVDLYLRRNNSHDALFYWEQARQFHDASKGLPINSAPLLLYYSFMNATKALLSSKNCAFAPHHGVKGELLSADRRKISLSTEGVRFKSSGIVPSLSEYFCETESVRVHSLDVMLHNMVFVHRTYCLTYLSRAEMFFPLREAIYERDDVTGQIRLKAFVASDADWKKLRRKLPPSFERYPNGGDRCVRSVDFRNWDTSDDPSASEIQDLKDLHRSLRPDLLYIDGSETLWYLKSAGPRNLSRRSPTLILAAMHRLSEICRYRPIELASYMNGQQNWLINEFVTMSPAQFIDEIASEITGHQFMTPNVRVPK